MVIGLETLMRLQVFMSPWIHYLVLISILDMKNSHEDEPALGTVHNLFRVGL